MSVLLGFLAFLKDVFVFTVRLGLDLLCIALAIPVAVGTNGSAWRLPIHCVCLVLSNQSLVVPDLHAPVLVLSGVRHQDCTPVL